MKKKLALACTLIHTPSIIFLDEPSTGVDPVSRGEFWNILSEILHQGVTILMTTPYLDEAERCHRIGLLHRGRLLLEGTPAEVRAACPGRVYDVACDRPAEAYRALRTRWPSANLVLLGGRLRFWSKSGAADAEAARALLDERGLGPASFADTEPTLEDAFIGLTGAAAPPGGTP